MSDVTFASGNEGGTQNCRLAEPITIVIEGGGNCLEANWRGEGGLARARDVFTVSQGGLGAGLEGSPIFRGLVVVNPTPTMKTGAYKAVGGKKRTFEVEIKLAFLPEQDAQQMLETIINSCLGDIGSAVTSVDIDFGSTPPPAGSLPGTLPTPNTFTRGDTYPNFQNLGAYLDATVPQYGCIWGVNAMGILFVKPTIPPESINNVFYDICAVEHEIGSEELITAIRWILATDVIFHACTLTSNRISGPANVTIGPSGINSVGAVRPPLFETQSLLQVGEVAPIYNSVPPFSDGYAAAEIDPNVRYALLTHRSSGSGPQEAVQSRALNPWSQWYKLLPPLSVISTVSNGRDFINVLDGDYTTFSKAFNYGQNVGDNDREPGISRGVTPNDYYALGVKLPKQSRGVFVTYSGATAGVMLVEYIGLNTKRQLCQFMLPPISSATECKVIIPIDARVSDTAELLEVNVYFYSNNTFDFRIYEVKALEVDTTLLDNFAQVLYRTENAGSKEIKGYVAPTGGFASYTYRITSQGDCYTTISTEKTTDAEEAAFAAIVRAKEYRSTDNAVRHAGGK